MALQNSTERWTGKCGFSALFEGSHNKADSPLATPQLLSDLEYLPPTELMGGWVGYLQHMFHAPHTKLSTSKQIGEREREKREGEGGREKEKGEKERERERNMS